MSLPESIQYNFWWKLSAVGLATLIWFTVHFGAGHRTGSVGSTNLFSQTQTRRLEEVPVRVLTSVGDSSRFRVMPDKIEVVLRGDANVLRRLQPSDIEAYVNLADVEAAQSLQMRIQLYVPTGVRVDSLQPANAFIEKLSESNDTRSRPN